MGAAEGTCRAGATADWETTGSSGAPGQTRQCVRQHVDVRTHGVARPRDPRGGIGPVLHAPVTDDERRGMLGLTVARLLEHAGILPDALRRKLRARA